MLQKLLLQFVKNMLLHRSAENAQKVLAAKGPEEVHVVRYIMSVKEALEFRSSHRRFFVVRIDTVTKVCSAVSADLHITFVVTFLQDVADVLLGGEHAESHCFVDSAKLEFFYNADLVLEELLKFLEDCMGKKCCKSLK
ncbi:hypothetical protein FRX31_020387 [Thalictrum thalictroides]|uniref:Uncharacterized protein n=1 Tax=Thalictrum thalictroides TaxID=46969 RepID=A0A7J6VZQ4_THATH|nr:hypothetical protein FRX31_020387 [Thalictrum thalictroides]